VFDSYVQANCMPTGAWAKSQAIGGFERTARQTRENPGEASFPQNGRPVPFEGVTWFVARRKRLRPSVGSLTVRWRESSVTFTALLIRIDQVYRGVVLYAWVAFDNSFRRDGEPKLNGPHAWIQQA